MKIFKRTLLSLCFGLILGLSVLGLGAGVSLLKPAGFSVDENEPTLNAVEESNKNNFADAEDFKEEPSAELLAQIEMYNKFVSANSGNVIIESVEFVESEKALTPDNNEMLLGATSQVSSGFSLLLGVEAEGANIVKITGVILGKDSVLIIPEEIRGRNVIEIKGLLLKFLMFQI